MLNTLSLTQGKFL